MTRPRSFLFATGWIALLWLLALPVAVRAQDASGISSRTATVEGVTLHYLTAGHGPAVILMHGYAQTSRMWRSRSFRKLAQRFTVIAPDPARNWRFVDSEGRAGHAKTAADSDPCAGEIAGH